VRVPISKRELKICLATCVALLFSSLVASGVLLHVLTAERAYLQTVQRSETKYREAYRLWRAETEHYRQQTIRLRDREVELLKENSRCWDQIRHLVRMVPMT